MFSKFFYDLLEVGEDLYLFGADELVAAESIRGKKLIGCDEDFLFHFEGEVCSDEATAAFSGFGEEEEVADACDNSVSLREASFGRFEIELEFGEDESAICDDGFDQIFCTASKVSSKSSSENCDGGKVVLKGELVAFLVDSAGESGDGHEVEGVELLEKGFHDFIGVGGHFSGSDDTEGGAIEEVEVSEGVEEMGRVLDVGEFERVSFHLLGVAGDVVLFHSLGEFLGGRAFKKLNLLRGKVVNFFYLSGSDVGV